MYNSLRRAIVGVFSNLYKSEDETDKEREHVTLNLSYTRPTFLELRAQADITESLHHVLRPIVMPRKDILPWATGYAECVNSGKSPYNEDQAAFYQFILPGIRIDELGLYRDVPEHILVTYFGIFDGHDGYGAALCASNQLHLLIKKNLLNVLVEIWKDLVGINKNEPNSEKYEICMDDLIIGAIEQAYLQMDEIIGEQKDNCVQTGGCTAIVALFVLNKVYIANAGDSRAVLVYYKGMRAKAISTDMTPERDSSRITKMAASKPELLENHFTWREYQRRPKPSDIGKSILYKDAWTCGWLSKKVTEDDLKIPMITGKGKQSRLMNTIGVVRGFGDHELCAMNGQIRIKPFLSACPEIKILNLEKYKLSEDDDNILIVGTDGFWDITSYTDVAKIAQNVLRRYRNSQRKKYMSIARRFVEYARGEPCGSSWKISNSNMYTGDDVSVFVIPIWNQSKIYTVFSALLIEKLSIAQGQENLSQDDKSYM